MHTDDFLADLGAQLRDARPRRDVRAPVALAVLAALAIAVLIVVPRGDERTAKQPAAPAVGQPRIVVLNGTTRPGIAGRAAANLRRAGYRVLRASNSPDQALATTTVDATSPRFAHAAAALRRRLGAARGTAAAVATSAAVAGPADIVVVLGADENLPALAKERLRVRVVNQSGSVDWAQQIVKRLRARGATVTDVGEAGRAFRTRVVPLGPDTGPATEAAAAIGRPGVVTTRGASPDGGAANAVVYLGSDLPGATLLERAIGLREAFCAPATPARRRRIGTAAAYVCQSPPNRFYDVAVEPDGTFVARRRGSGDDIRGTGAAP